MCLTPVLINHPAVIAVIVIEGCGEGGNVTFEGVSVMFGLRIRIICGCLSALNGGVSGIVVSDHSDDNDSDDNGGIYIFIVVTLFAELLINIFILINIYK